MKNSLTIGHGFLIQIAELDIYPAKLAQYKALLAEEIGVSVKIEPGVIFLHAVSLADAPETIRLMEGYKDEAAYQAHLQAPHFIKYKTETADMVRSLRLIETQTIASAGKAFISASSD